MNAAVPRRIEPHFGTKPPYELVHEWAEHYQWAAKGPVRAWRRIRREGACALHAGRDRVNRAAKRSFDVAFAFTLLVCSCPLWLLIAAAIKVTDRGPVLYWQKRVGLWGELFPFPKFRSMVVGADKMVENLIGQNHHGQSITFKMKRDPRVTWIGRIIRRFSLDELPQIWCVLRGQMSVVGPRPALPREVDNYTPSHRRRLGVRPGLTCIWQVSGRADVPFEGQVKMDVEY
ncbi:MAG TPA: sugar transferase, partial [Terriglobales bacterium]|nr:sugar transferase [Terriglobales bacterium]